MDIRATSVLPGRVRLKVRELRHNPTLADEIDARLRDRGGVSLVETNPLTGSVLVLYDPGRLTLKSLLAVGFPGEDTDKCLPATSMPKREPRPVARSTIAKAVREFRFRWRHGARHGGLRQWVPYGLLALGIRELLVARGPRPPWHALVWYAYCTYLGLSHFPGVGPPHGGGE